MKKNMYLKDVKVPKIILVKSTKNPMVWAYGNEARLSKSKSDKVETNWKETPKKTSKEAMDKWNFGKIKPTKFSKKKCTI